MKARLHQGLQRLANTAQHWIGHDSLALCSRMALAAIFWQSGQTKVKGWLNVSDSAIALFETGICLAADPARLGRLYGGLCRTCFSDFAGAGSADPSQCCEPVGHDGGDPDFCLPTGMADPPELGYPHVVPVGARRRPLVARPQLAPALNPSRHRARDFAHGVCASIR